MAWATEKKPAERIKHLEREKSEWESQALYKASVNEAEAWGGAVHR